MIDSLRIFRTAALKKSISAAARQHHLSQSAASTAIKRLEEELGLELLEHGKNRFQLTAQGYQLLERIDRLEEIVEEIESLKHVSSEGPWRLALSHSLAVALLPSLLKNLKAKLHVHIGHPTAIAEWINEGEMDLGLVIDQKPSLPCIKTPVLTGAFHLYGIQEYAIDAPVIMDCKKQESMELNQLFEKRWKRPLNHFLDIPSWEVIAALARNGLGVGFLPSIMEASHPELKRLDWKLPEISYDIVALTRRSPKVLGIATLIEEIKMEAYRGVFCIKKTP